MTTLFAQPYDISACGFYFETADEFTAKAIAATNDYGDPVEEFEIQFIDGADIDCELARAWVRVPRDGGHGFQRMVGSHSTRSWAPAFWLCFGRQFCRATRPS